MTEVAATIAASLIAVVALFQLALVFGAPWGQAAWGGQNPGRLPARLRVASLGSAVLLILMAWVILATAGIVEVPPVPTSWLRPLTWVITAYFSLGAVMNLISRSRLERIWSPVSLVIAVCCALVAAS